jgi:hypothetical protein
VKTFKQFFESNRAFHDQTYSDGDQSWKVPEIEKFAKKHGRKEKISIEELERHLEPTDEESGDERPDSPEFAERAMKADLSYPIIAIDYGGDRGPDGWLADYDKGIWIADGVHRIFKAKKSGQKEIDALIITDEELNSIDHGNI